MTGTCDTCGGTLQVLGTLGNVNWFRCRNCGRDASDIAEAFNLLNDEDLSSEFGRSTHMNPLGGTA